MNRKAHETLRIIQDGGYTIDGNTVDIAAALSRPLSGSKYLGPADAQRIAEKLTPKGKASQTELENESTLAAILRLGGGDGIKLAGRTKWGRQTVWKSIGSNPRVS
jgi:hypothetical protein